MTEVRRLHWGCGDITPSDWINADISVGAGIDISCNILDGLPLDSDSIDYVYSEHALQQLKILDVVDALRELHRQTSSFCPEVVTLDSWQGEDREWESFYVEAFKSARR